MGNEGAKEAGGERKRIRSCETSPAPFTSGDGDGPPSFPPYPYLLFIPRLIFLQSTRVDGFTGLATPSLGYPGWCFCCGNLDRARLTMVPPPFLPETISSRKTTLRAFILQMLFRELSVSDEILLCRCSSHFPFFL